MKKSIVNQVKELTTGTTIQAAHQQQSEASVVFSVVADFFKYCSSFGRLLQHTSPGQSSAGFEATTIAYATPSQVIEGLTSPWGVIVNHKGEVIVSEENGHHISVFNSSGERFQHNGTVGSGDGQFDVPRGVVLDHEENVIMVDSENNRLQKFSAEGEFLAAVGSEGSEPL